MVGGGGSAVSVFLPFLTAYILPLSPPHPGKNQTRYGEGGCLLACF